MNPFQTFSWTLGIVLGLAGCGARETPAGPTGTTPVATQSQGSEPVILLSLDNGFHPVPIPMTTDHGFLVANVGDDDHPEPRVSVGSRPDRRVRACGSLAEFEKAIGEIPAGTLIHRYERCLRPASSGLDEGFIQGVEAILVQARTRGIHVAAEPVVTCLCGK